MLFRFYEELKRHNYVTPTSYLELILTFQNLYHRKVEQIVGLRTRYEVGLEKLDFAAGQVCDYVFCACYNIKTYLSTLSA